MQPRGPSGGRVADTSAASPPLTVAQLHIKRIVRLGCSQDASRYCEPLWEQRKVSLMQSQKQILKVVKSEEIFLIATS